jgi:hypothetical protein
MANDVDTSSELSKIAKLNGDFRRNYGTLIGAVLYLRTVSAARRSPWLWAGLISVAFSTVLELVGAARLVFASVVLMASNNAPFSW